MTQYISKSALVAELKRKIKEIDEIGTYLSPKGTLTNLLCFLDTLEVKEVQEEPAHCTGIGEPKEESGVLGEMIKEMKKEPKDHCKDLNEEPVSEDLEKAAVNAFKQIVDSGKNNFLEIFKAGAEWQKQKMMKGALELDVIGHGSGWLSFGYLPECEYNFKNGHKVKVIIIEED